MATERFKWLKVDLGGLWTRSWEFPAQPRHRRNVRSPRLTVRW